MYKRKRAPKYKRRRVRRRFVKRRRIGRTSAMITKRFKQLVVASTNDTFGNNVFASLAFKLTDLEANTEFTNLFERYKICGIKYRFYVDRNTEVTSSSLPPGNTHVTRVWHHVDYTDTTTPTFEGMNQQPNLKIEMLNSSKPYSRWYFFKPKFSNTIWGSTTEGYSQMRGYVDSEFPAVTHYGLKYIVNDMQSYQNVYIQTWYYLALKNVK